MLLLLLLPRLDLGAVLPVLPVTLWGVAAARLSCSRAAAAGELGCETVLLLLLLLLLLLPLSCCWKGCSLACCLCCQTYCFVERGVPGDGMLGLSPEFARCHW